MYFHLMTFPLSFFLSLLTQSDGYLCLSYFLSKNRNIRRIKCENILAFKKYYKNYKLKKLFGLDNF